MLMAILFGIDGMVWSERPHKTGWWCIDELGCWSSSVHMSAMRTGLPSYAVLTPSVSARVGTQAPGTQSHKLTISACKLWDAVEGTVAPLTATASGIFDVWLVYNSTNIWGNVQRPGAPSEMNWNLTDARCGPVVSDMISVTWWQAATAAFAVWKVPVEPSS